MNNDASIVRPFVENVLSQCNICKENKFNCKNKLKDNKYENGTTKQQKISLNYS